MSDALPPPTPTTTPTAPPGPPPAPIVQLKTWVNVVLVLILLGSCSSASNVQDRVFQTSDGSSVASQDEVTDMCRLLGAVVAKQGIDLDTVFAGSATITQCQGAARGTPAP